MALSLNSGDDVRWMRAALSLARRGLGTVAPNPAVGCILVKGGKVISRGWTQPGGRPHAETEALGRAGDAARGATAYVTLEPCSHTGQTGPCADALINAGVTRVVAALEDPDTRVAGRGLNKLRNAGITVDLGVLADEAEDLNKGFLLHRTENRPLVLLKLATSLDGKIATADGESKWITGPEARMHAQTLRQSYDAVLVGIETALADDPALTVRLPGVTHRGMRIVLDGRGRLPVTAQFCDGSIPTVQIVSPVCSTPDLPNVERRVVPVEGRDLSVPDILTTLADLGVTRLMIEGGGTVAASFLKAGMVDRIAWYRAAKTLGSTGRSGVGDLALLSLASAPQFRFEGSVSLGPDRLDQFVRS